MLGVGSSALVAKTLGEGDVHLARRYFTMMMYLMLGSSVVFTALGIAVLRPVACDGSHDRRRDDLRHDLPAVQHSAARAVYVPELSHHGGEAEAGAVGCCRGGAGAALATGLSECIGGLVPLFWFLSKKNKSALRFTRTSFEVKPMLLACGNGASEMLSGVSGSITGILYNLQLMKYAGEDGVAAYGVVMYAAISFMRALVLPVICIIVMPMLWKLDGVWYSLVASEILGVFVSLYFLPGKRKKYQY